MTHLSGQRGRHAAGCCKLTALALLGVTGYNTMLYIGLQDTTATNALLLSSATPVLIVALSFVVLRHRPRLLALLGLALSLAGVWLIVSAGEPTRLLDIGLRPGDAWILATTLDWAIYSVLLRLRPAGPGWAGPRGFPDRAGGARPAAIGGTLRLGAAPGHRAHAECGQPRGHRLCGAVPVGAGLPLLEPRRRRTRRQPHGPIHAPGAGVRHPAGRAGARRAAAMVPRRGGGADRRGHRAERAALKARLWSYRRLGRSPKCHCRKVSTSSASSSRSSSSSKARVEIR